MSELVHFRHAAFAPAGPPPPLTGVAYLLVGGIEYGPFNITIADLQLFDLFALTFVGPVHAKYDNFTAGTTGYGSSDVFSDTFGSGPIPPWDSIFDDGSTTVAVSGGTLNIDQSGTTPPGGFYLGGVEVTVAAPHPELWFQFDVTLTAATIAAISGTVGSEDIDLFDVATATFSDFVELSINDFATGEWLISDGAAGGGTTSGADVPVADTPFTIGFHVVAN